MVRKVEEITAVNEARMDMAMGNVDQQGVPLAIGPCVVTTDECDPQAMFLQAKVEGHEMAKGNLNGAARSLFELVAFASRGTTLERATIGGRTTFWCPKEQT